MLLKLLTDQAARIPELPPPHYRAKQIHWVVSITADGARVGVSDVRPPKGSSVPPQIMPVPHTYRSGKLPPANLLVDTAQYVLGVPKPDPTTGEITQAATEEARRRHEEYLTLLRQWASTNSGERSVAALLRFLDDNSLTSLAEGEGIAAGDIVALLVADTWLHTLPSAQKAWAETVRRRKAGGTPPGLCLVCGETRPLLATIPESVKAGAIPSSGRGRDAQLVSINAAAHGRGGISDGLAGTPVCEECGSRAMAVLNHLLAAPEHHRRGPDHVFLWWTREPVQEKITHALYDADPDPKDIAHFFDALRREADPTSLEDVDSNDFFGLTLTLNNARVVVRDWVNTSVERVKANFGAWYRDHAVYDGWQDRDRYLPLWLLAAASGRRDTARNRYVADTGHHGLERTLLHSALHRAGPPAQLLPHLLQRIRADGHIDAARIALLRLILIRVYQERELVSRLDENNTDPAYLCGRAFAVLESIQRKALGPDVNTTLRDKYFRTAMTAPAAVFATLRRDAVGHLKRLRRDNAGARVALEKRLGEVFAAMDGHAGIPLTFNPREQGIFIIGYEQQRAADFAAAREHGDGDQ
ncbi:type I-C CRISPR-associated protein Cas8c/Csd1 [Streptomyces hoynatensis]|uniref:type I-C CRISPR-associated protein Cas8c/Csd1 n=1 Tax=Streptomyces hoynatensis TaxID=1141874 RepID=UPI001319EC02|nr:type I-C CRISPR-associated protein Cas8c/Csd1 [Streptomyces hoynatensis]